MNKLYKYLPFGIKGKIKNIRYSNIKETEAKLIGIKGDSTDWGYIVTQSWIMDEVIDFKPILRPFEDLTKELPLTKAAAEMIRLEEGVLVNPLAMMFRYNNKLTGFEFQNVSATNVSYGFVINLNTETKYVKVDVDIEIDSNFNFSINSYVWQKKENYRVASCYYTINPTCLDFLRAMCFNLDFKEDEFIKLEN